MITHSEMVSALVKPGKTILKEMEPWQANVLHMAVGVSGEAGELLDAAKKVAIYQKEPTAAWRENVIEELGDLEFYMEGLRQELNITRKQTLDVNIEKLGKRYEQFQYSNKAAIDRVDKTTV